MLLEAFLVALRRLPGDDVGVFDPGALPVAGGQ